MDHSMKKKGCSSMKQFSRRHAAFISKHGSSRNHSSANSRNENNSIPLTLQSVILSPVESEPPKENKDTGINLRDFRLKHALKRITKKLYGLTVQQLPSEGQVKEEWQRHPQEKNEQEIEPSSWLLNQSAAFTRIMQFFLAVAYLMTCWYLSVRLVFNTGEFSRIAIAGLSIVLVVDVLLQLNTVKSHREHLLRTRFKIWVDYVKKQLWIDLAIPVFLTANQLITNEELAVLSQTVALLALAVKFNRKSELVRTYFESKKYVALVDSVLLLMIVSHINALLLFLSSKFVPENCWLGHIGIQAASWKVRYLYSLYWSVTTVVTVGYGDITPQNEYEVAVTIIIELVGSALFGYLINIIGMTMTELKKQKENLKEELGIADKMSKCLSLNEDLGYQMKSFLKDNQKADSYFSLKDESRIWTKLGSDLRHRTYNTKKGILLETNIRVIKKCLFFLTYFSRTLQDVIAPKLIKRVFQPNEVLGFEASNRSLYIIDHGKAELQAIRPHFQKTMAKTLRVINKDPKRDNQLGISSNLFGFTTLLLKRKVNLAAVSREFIVTYELQQKDFEESVSHYPADFQTVCELRDCILNTSIPESYEGPELVDPSLHFIPIKYLSIRKHNRNHKQVRVRRVRLDANMQDRYQFLDTIPQSDQSIQSDCSSGQNKLTQLKTRMNNFEEDLQASNYSAKQQHKPTEAADFDQMKKYSKYMVASNLEAILQKRAPPLQSSLMKSKCSRARFAS